MDAARRRGMSGVVNPSGKQFDIRHADQHAWIVEVGGSLRAYRVAGRDVLDGYDAAERCTGARGQSLIPWPNRVRDGRYHFDAEDHQLALSEPDNHNAIHGLTRWANWSVADHREDRLTMRHRLHPQPGYPFALDLAITYRLSDDGLSVCTTATNIGDARCPYGAGAHPYLTVGTPTIDSIVLRAPGQALIPSDERGIPTGTRPVDETPYDFRTRRSLGSVKLDTGYTDLERTSDGRARVELFAPDESTTTLWLDDTHPYLMLYTGDSLPDPDRRRRGLGIEPMTCAPNAFQSGDGLRILQAGETFTSTWGITTSPRHGD